LPFFDDSTILARFAKIAQLVEQRTRNAQVLSSILSLGSSAAEPRGRGPRATCIMHSLLDWLKSCEICPNSCRVDRTAGKRGRCRTADGIVVSAADLHFGEEPCLVGRGGSGTIFLTACNLSCRYCQNYDISQLDRGKPISESELVRLMLGLQMRGAENINFVSPTHQAAQLFHAVQKARSKDLKVPIVYNCGGYENPRFLRELESLVDIYMPDFKYASDEAARRYSGVDGYADACRAALKEMYRQVGDLRLSANGTAETGLLVRHLVLPGGIAGSRAVIDFLVSEVSPRTYLNIMDQYHPAFRAGEFTELSRRVSRFEVEEVVEYARKRGMTRLLG
jgi:putative pyruvate formate lyase activating enzyme